MLLRRLAALCYDTLLVIALAMAATFALLPITGGEAILVSTHPSVARLYQALVVLLCFAYFAIGWTRSGQTLGMKAWRIRLVGENGRRVSWAAAAVRFTLGMTIALLALAGGWQLARPGWALADALAALLFLPALGNLAWIRIDAAARSLQDLAGGLRITRV